MKKLFSILAVAFLCAAPMSSQRVQQLVVNGETVEKTVAKMTFEGDNVVITFDDNQTQTAVMNTVVLNFVDPSGIQNISFFKMKGLVDGNISINGLPEGTQVVVYDMNGRQMLSTAGSQIDATGLKSGVYMLKAGNQVVKFMKR